MSEILDETPLNGVSSDPEAAWREYVLRRDAHMSEYLANCDEIARIYLAECGTPEAMAQWCDSFLAELAARHDPFLREYRSELDVLARVARLARQQELARLARQQELREECDEHFPQGSASWKESYVWVRERASIEEITEAVAHGVDIRVYGDLRAPAGAGASHEEILDAAAKRVVLSGYMTARNGASLRPSDPQRDTRASHQEVMEIHAMGLGKAKDLRAYTTARARSSHAEVKEALAEGAVTAEFLLAYAKKLRGGDTHAEIMDTLLIWGVAALLGP